LLYLLDANILIDANMYYYPIDRVPEFWDWLLMLGQTGVVKIPVEIFDEVVNPLPPVDRRDAVVGWLKENESILLFLEDSRTELVMEVAVEGYGHNLTEEEQEKIGRDPFLIAYALVDPENRCVVTNERSRPSQRRGNRHIPDVCREQNIDVRCINVFDLIRELDFRTDWQRRL